MSKMKTLDNIRPHVLFNLINQCKPLCFLDFRSIEIFSSCRIRGSCNISVESCAESGLEKLLTRTYLRYSMFLVCVIDESTSMEKFSVPFEELKRNAAAAAEHTDVTIKTIWTQIRSVLYIKYNDFFPLYNKCISIFEGDTIAPLRKGLITYFPSEIVSGFLYLGDYRDGSDEVTLSALGITHIVDATGESNSQSTAEALSIHYLHVNIWDLEGVDITAYFEEVIAFIDGAKSSVGDGMNGMHARVLVHCRAGISRSATFVLAYLLQTRIAYSLSDAYRLVMEERPVCPNASFRQQLRALEARVQPPSHSSCPSFTDDEDNMRLLRSMSHSWSGFFSIESDHDRTPILTGKFADLFTATCIDEYPNPGAGAKPKKPFLKRGQGKRVT